MIEGKVLKYGDNVDTDVIIPARYLNDSTPEHLAAHCMEDIDSGFAARRRPGDIMVGGWNFGCGSSREHAPLAIKSSGISVVIAKSFARIFYRNAINIGLAIVECPEAADTVRDGDTVSADLQAGVITDVTTGETFHAEPFPEFIQAIIDAGGLVESAKSKVFARLFQKAAGSNATCGGVGKAPGGFGQSPTIALLRGDGIGPEIVDSAVRVLEATGEKFSHTFRFTPYLIGGAALDATGVPLPEETVEGCLASDSVLLGAVGGPKWDILPGDKRPEKALLGIRSALGLYTNLRPARLYPALAGDCPLRPDIVRNGFDIMIVRELTGGIYFGDRGFREGKFGQEAFDTECYSRMEIERIARAAFEAARKRRGKVTSIDKANVLETSRLWRKTVHEVASEYPDVSLNDMLVDNAAMQLVRDPGQFDVIVTSNMFGDILSDEASQITGSIGLLPSASLGETTRGLYEPIHGSAPDIAGKNVANPIATILSAAMMLRYAFGFAREADAVENAVDAVLNDGLRTADLLGNRPGKALSTTEMTDEIIRRLKSC